MPPYILGPSWPPSLHLHPVTVATACPWKGPGHHTGRSGLSTHSTPVSHQQHYACVAGDQLQAKSWPMNLLATLMHVLSVLWHRGLKVLGGHWSAMNWDRRPCINEMNGSPSSKSPLARAWSRNSTVTEEKLSIIQAKGNEYPYCGTGPAPDSQASRKYSFSHLYGKVGEGRRIPSLPSSNLPQFGLNLSFLSSLRHPPEMSYEIIWNVLFQ